MRLPTYGGLFAWECEQEGHELRLRVEGQAVVNHDAMRLGSVPDGLGLADVNSGLMDRRWDKRPCGQS